MVRNRLLLLIIMFFLIGCGMRVNIMGVDTKLLEQRKWGQAVTGALVSVAVHESAHYLVAKAKGRDIEFHGTTFEYEKQDDMIDRSGFLAQTMIGLALNQMPATRGSDFIFGWNAAATLQLYSYPARHKDDGDFSDIGKNEWAWFTFMSTFNTHSTVNKFSQE